MILIKQKNMLLLRDISMTIIQIFLSKTDENGQTHNISLRILVNSESKERRQTAVKAFR